MDGLFSLSLSRFLIERANIFFRPLELASNLPRSVGRLVDRSIDRQRGDNEQRRCTMDITRRSPHQPRIICKHARFDGRERNARFFHADGGR